MSVAELVVTKGGLKYILIGTAGKELFLFSLPSFELMGQLKLQQSVHAVNFIANGFALVAVQDRLISIGINKNSIENLGESD
jgi:NADH:ubiquinone oxidoreductase subunit 2 (subunit N)